MKTGFCHLHLHTRHSMLDGLCSFHDVLAEAERWGMDAVAITDHHNVSGVIEFYQLAQEYGIKPIIGAELNVGSILREDSTRLYHLIVLSKNNVGYINLLRLITISNLTNDGVVTRSMLEEHKQGLIILSGCCAGEIDDWIISDYPRAREAALEYRNIFGQNNYYLELERTGAAGEEEMIGQKVRLARDLNIPLVATNNVHYHRREDAEIYQILPQIGRLSFEEAYPVKMREEYYLKSPDEMALLFQDLPEALTNTLHIAGRCNLFLDFAQRNFPRFPVPTGMTAESYLAELCQHELECRYPHNGKCDSISQEQSTAVSPSAITPAQDAGRVNPVSRQMAVARLTYELDVISQMGYAGYFLIIWDLVQYAKGEGILTSGRGSAAGSLICYLLGITLVDPLEYGLYFERFIHPERPVLPDIDLDLDHYGRKKVFQYLANKYGTANVAHLSMVNTLAGVSVVRDVARIQGWPEEKLSPLVKFISRENLHQIDAFNNSQEFKQLYARNSAFRKLVDTVQELDGLPRHLSEHSTGIVISQDPLTNYTALQYSRDGEVITQSDLQAIQTMGLFKLDLLGVRFLSAIRCTLKVLKETRGLTVQIDDIPFDDLKTYRQLQRGDTVGCFELESDTARKLVQQVRPRSILEIMFVMVLTRLADVDQELVQRFLGRLHEVEEVEYPHPLLESVLHETYGLIFFQEQIMQIAEELAGFSLAGADRLRVVMLKKDRIELAELKSTFIKGATARGLSVAEANYIFDKLHYYARYGLCKAHYATYARLAYITAYLKQHYPVEYLTSLFNVHLDLDYRSRKYLHQARYHHIPILSLDINQSKPYASVEGEAIRPGLLQVKGIGRRIIEEITVQRKVGEYGSLRDFIERVDRRVICQHVVEQLIKAGSFDRFGQRKELLKECSQIFENAAPIHNDYLKE